MRLEFHISLMFDWLNLMPQAQSLKRMPISSVQSSDLVQVCNTNIIASSQLVTPNFPLVYLIQAIPAAVLVLMFGCMLLEKKLILIGSDAKYQSELALIIEGLLLVFEPLDSQVFTNITFAFSPEMVMYMDKPGSLIMGMSQTMWQQHGQPYWTSFSQDTFIVICNVTTNEVYTKTELGEISSDSDLLSKLSPPEPFRDLLIKTLEGIKHKLDNVQVSQDSASTLLFQIETQMAVKQAFFNTLVLLVRTINVVSNDDKKLADSSLIGFINEFSTTTSLIDLQQRIGRQELPIEQFAKCLGQLADSNLLIGFQELLKQQTADMLNVLQKLKSDSEIEHNWASIVKNYTSRKQQPISAQQSLNTFFRLNKDLIDNSLRQNILKDKKKLVIVQQKKTKKTSIQKSQSQALLQRIERIKSIEKPGLVRGAAKSKNKVINSDSDTPKGKESEPASTVAASANETSIRETVKNTPADFNFSAASQSIAAPDASPSENSLIVDEIKQSGFVSFFTNLFLSRHQSADKEATEETKQVVRKHSMSHRLANETQSVFMRIVANQIFFKSSLTDPTTQFLADLKQLEFLTDQSATEHPTENVQNEEILGRSKTQSMQISLNSLLQKRQTVTSPKNNDFQSVKPESADLIDQRKPLNFFHPPEQKIPQAKSLVAQRNNSLKTPGFDMQENLRSPDSKRKQTLHSMIFCDDPKQCQQCQLLSLVSGVSINSPNKQLESIKEIKEASPQLTVMRVTSPRNLATPRKLTNQAQSGKYTRLESDQFPPHQNEDMEIRLPKRIKGSPEKGKQVKENINADPDPVFFGLLPIKSDSPEITNAKPSSSQNLLRKSYQNPFDNLDPLSKPENRLQTLQEEDSKGHSSRDMVVVIDSPSLLSPQQLPSRLLQPNYSTQSKEKGNKEGTLRASTQIIQAAPEVARRQTLPYSSIKKAKIVLGLDAQGKPEQVHGQVNLASSFGSQSNAQNSFVANVLEQIASPIKLRKIENSVLSPQAYASNSVNTSDIFGLRETMRDTDHKTIVAQQTRGKISMHKALAKNQSTLLKQHSSNAIFSNDANLLKKQQKKTPHRQIEPKEEKTVTAQPNSSKRQTVKSSSNKSSQFKLSELINKSSKNSTFKKMQTVRTKQLDDGWFASEPGGRARQEDSPSNDSDIADTSEDSQRRPDLKPEETKRDSLVQVPNLHSSAQPSSVFMRPKAVSVKSDGIGSNSVLRNSLPNSTQSQLGGLSRIVQAGVKVNFGQTNQVDFMEGVQREKSKSTLPNQTEAIQQIARRKEMAAELDASRHH